MWLQSIQPHIFSIHFWSWESWGPDFAPRAAAVLGPMTSASRLQRTSLSFPESSAGSWSQGLVMQVASQIPGAVNPSHQTSQLRSSRSSHRENAPKRWLVWLFTDYLVSKHSVDHHFTHSHHVPHFGVSQIVGQTLHSHRPTSHDSIG